ncbi:MAG: endonuclease domain-containing protein [Burkholderiales bacterium]
MPRRALPRPDPAGLAFARGLRTRTTEAENRLWYFLRDRRFRGAKFRRQVPVGPYVVDFLCVSAALVVEVDGGQHSERVDRDEARSRFLEAKGFRVLRFWNDEVMGNIEGVMEVIAHGLTPDPSPEGEGRFLLPHPPHPRPLS